MKRYAAERDRPNSGSACQWAWRSWCVARGPRRMSWSSGCTFRWCVTGFGDGAVEDVRDLLAERRELRSTADVVGSGTAPRHLDLLDDPARTRTEDAHAVGEEGRLVDVVGDEQ